MKSFSFIYERGYYHRKIYVKLHEAVYVGEKLQMKFNCFSINEAQNICVNNLKPYINS